MPCSGRFMSVLDDVVAATETWRSLPKQEILRLRRIQESSHPPHAHHAFHLSGSAGVSETFSVAADRPSTALRSVRSSVIAASWREWPASVLKREAAVDWRLQWSAVPQPRRSSCVHALGEAINRFPLELLHPRGLPGTKYVLGICRLDTHA